MDPVRTQYIEHIKDVAIKLTSGTGLFASLMIAQACLESANGVSFLARVHNNHFGIKSNPAWKGGIVSLPTTEVVKGKVIKTDAVFRSYPSLEEGFKDRNHFLQVNTIYRANGVFSAATPEDQAKALVRAGYATDPAYAVKLSQLIMQFNLKQYDI
jgi:flagellum-specific peptidoglycan hydrolase FlgJ